MRQELTREQVERIMAGIATFTPWKHEVNFILAHDQAQRERIQKLESALISLTPGGSEYYNDPDRCVRYVQEARESTKEVILSFKRQRDAAIASASTAPRAEHGPVGTK